MAEVVPNPNREINDAQKRIFVEAFERLDSFITLDVPTPQALSESKENRSYEIEIHKIGNFKMDGAHFILESSEVIDDRNEEVLTSRLWSATVTPPSIYVADVEVSRESLYIVGIDDQENWDAEFSTQTRSQGPYDKYPRLCLSDDEIEMQAFWAGHPSEEDQQARAVMIDQELEESESYVPLQSRFTQQRMADILPWLVKLGQQHLVLSDL